MDEATKFLDTLAFCQGQIPTLRHITHFELYHPENNHITILDGDETIRTIKYEEEDICYSSATNCVLDYTARKRGTK